MLVNEHARLCLKLTGWEVMTEFYHRKAIIIALFYNFRTRRVRALANCRQSNCNLISSLTLLQKYISFLHVFVLAVPRYQNGF